MTRLIVATGLLLSALTANAGSLDEELLKSVLAGDLAGATALLDGGADPNYDVPASSTPLWAAITAKGLNPAVLKLLVDRGAKVNHVGHNSSWGGMTPLMQATAWGTPEMVGILLGAGAKVNLEIKSATGWHEGYTALHYASTPEKAKLLIDAGAKLNHAAGPCGTPPLSIAVRYWPAVAKLLLEAGAKGNVATTELCDSADEKNRSALSWAVLRGETDLVALLIKRGAKVNERWDYSCGATPLLAAAALGHARMAEILLEAGADRKTAAAAGSGYWFGGYRWACKETVGLGALDIAVMSGQPETTKLLLKGESALSKRADGGAGLLETAVRAGNAGLTGLLLASGAPVNARAADCGHGALTLAVLKESSPTVKAILEAVPDLEAQASPDCPNWKGMTAMDVAVWHAGHSKSKPQDGSMEIVGLLAAKRARVDHAWPGDCAGNPLIHAVRYGTIPLVKLLLGSGADPMATASCPSISNPKLLTPLRTAIEGKRPEMVTLLLEKGAKVDARLGGEDQPFPLALAIKEGDAAMVSLLLDNGAAIDAVMTAHRERALDLALYQKNTEIVTLLLAKGAAVNYQFGRAYLSGSDRVTPLAYAARSGTDDIVKRLLAAGAEVDAKMEGHHWGGETALDLALGNGNIESIRLLAAKSKLLNEPLNNNSRCGRTRLMNAADDLKAEVVKALLESGADPDLQVAPSATLACKPEEFYLGKTALHFAIARKDLEKVKLLSIRGSKALHAREKISESVPLRLALLNDNMEMVKVLLDAGADPNQPGTLHLEEAAFNGKIGLARLLLSRGARVNPTLEPPLCRTPLISGAIKGHVEIVKLLLDAGADLYASAPDRDDCGRFGGKTALDMAKEDKQEVVVRLLESRMFAVAPQAGAAATSGLGREEMRSMVAEAVRSAAPQAPAQPALDKEELRRMMAEAVRSAAPAAVPGPRASSAKSDIDKPVYKLAQRPEDFAVVVGIQSYAELPDAAFAERDAEAVKNHLLALGFPSRNVVHLAGDRAGYKSIEKFVETWLPRNVGAESRVFFYFSGHGAPKAETGEAYLVPWDGDPNFLENTGYPMKRLYQKLGDLKAREVIVALDACFSGAGGRSVLPKGARPLVMRAAPEKALPEKLLVFAAAQGQEITGSIEEEGHGLFTYHFLKGLSGGAKDASGTVTAGNLYDYLKPKVQDAARRQNRAQMPELSGDRKERVLAKF